MRILVNGVDGDGMIPVTDSSVLRGDGCFEVLRAYEGRPFALDEHLERLRRSAAALGIPLPEPESIAGWVRTVALEGGDCAVRLVVTRGSALPGADGEPLVVVFAHPWSRAPGPATLLPVDAPWHAAGAEWDLAGAKILSYAPNMAASRRAAAEGYDDAILVSATGSILEGPTFSVAWVVDGVLETPSLGLGILDSITRRFALEDAAELGIEVVEGSWGLDRLASAVEVMALSTIREVQPVAKVGAFSFPEGPVTARLGRMLGRRIASLRGTTEGSAALRGT